MDIQLMMNFFMWCTVLNAVFLLITSLMLSCASEFVFKMTGLIFPLSREAFTMSNYAIIGAYKFFIIFFNLVPWIALAVIS